MLRIQLKIILYLKKLIPKNNIDKFDDEFIHEIIYDSSNNTDKNIINFNNYINPILQALDGASDKIKQQIKFFYLNIFFILFMAINNTVLLFGYELVKLSIYLTLKKIILQK